MGSPPPTRGKLILKLCCENVNRITPAYAGKTQCRRRAVPLIEDHPRLRGENKEKAYKVTCGTGSPPPTRGKQCPALPYVLHTGITPAYAGKTFLRGKAAHTTKDHPRLRGENRIPCLRLFLGLGSPPPTRGKLGRVVDDAEIIRITPAYAGKTLYPTP